MKKAYVLKIVTCQYGPIITHSSVTGYSFESGMLKIEFENNRIKYILINPGFEMTVDEAKSVWKDKSKIKQDTSTVIQNSKE